MSVLPENDLFRYLAKLPDPLAREILDTAERVAAHPLFRRLDSTADVRVFMEHHVWAVWDFMSLLKSVQAAIAPVRVPWCPPADAVSARLINEIVVGEECDEGPEGAPASHFEIYLGAMERAGADTGPIRGFVADLGAGLPWEAALSQSGAPPQARAFVATTMAICAGPAHGRVAALTVGREEIIPAMFRRLVGELGRGAQGACPRGDELAGLRWYLDRHVAVDGDSHGPMTARLFQRICARDPEALAESLEVARRVLVRRKALWDAVLSAIQARRPRALLSHAHSP